LLGQKGKPRKPKKKQPCLFKRNGRAWKSIIGRSQVTKAGTDKKKAKKSRKAFVETKPETGQSNIEVWRLMKLEKGTQTL